MIGLLAPECPACLCVSLSLSVCVRSNQSTSQIRVPGVEPPTKLSKKKRGGGRGLTGSQFLEGCCWERRGDIFGGRGVAVVTKKKKIKSEIFNNKKIINKNLKTGFGRPVRTRLLAMF